MREIKFRVWNKRTKLIKNVERIFFNENTVQVKNDLDSLTWFLDHCKLMQYTGLKDKNGKEIYEGDICSFWDDSIVIVRWNEEGFWQGWGVLKISKVIGNIYENPELVKIKTRLID